VKSCGEKVVAERLLVSGVMALGSGYLTFNLLKKLLLFYEIYNIFHKGKDKVDGQSPVDSACLLPRAPLLLLH
jgi:hypothetical protein